MKSLVKSKFFCILPWLHLNGHPDGSVHLCCFSNNRYPVGNINNESMQSIINNKNMIEIRNKMINGQPIPACVSCYEKEATKNESFRQKMNNFFKKDVKSVSSNYVDDFKLKYLDVRFNNKCNFSCRSCSGEFSTSWYKEESTIFNIKRNYSNNISKTFIKEIKPHIIFLEKVYIGGGEPLLAKETILILNELLVYKKTNIPITINTNLSNFKNFALRHNSLLKQFSNITILASIDADNKKAEYIRFGTNWNIIYENLLFLKNNFTKINLEINCTISILNIFSFTDLYFNLLKSNFISSDKFKCNLLHQPLYLRSDILPEIQKQKAIKKIKKSLSKINNDTKKEFLSVILFLQNKNYSFLIDEFLKNSKILDESRKQSLFDYCPELIFLNNRR